jgi:murein DD-endopeptidase MepM/ murein hydrolase activator NlpD
MRGGLVSQHPVQGRFLKIAAMALAAAILPASDAGAARPYLERAQAVHPTFFQRGEYGAGYRFRVEHETAREVSVRVRLYRGEVEDGRLIHTWDLGWVPPGARQAVNWHGALPGGGWAMQGRYTLEVRARDRAGRRLDGDSLERSRVQVRFYRHAFPVRGRHDTGERGARFGARRAGHGHQGHDVFARKGTRVVAARRGRVVFSEHQSGAAGNYLVVRGDDGRDYAYMHLRGRPRHDVGDLVRTGERIGRVGCTGSCSAPHLHFEMWTPHWWDGGEPFDPLPHLRRWDRWS